VRRIQFTVRRTLTVRTRVQVRRVVHAQTHFAQTANRSIETSARVLPTAHASQHLANEGFGAIEDPDREFDLFLSHASEDKAFTRPLAEALAQRGLHVWFDETAIRIGDSLRESIDRGLTRSRFGVVVFSHSFFAKKWTNYELNGLVTREVQGRKVILPVWHPLLSLEDLAGYSPSLADKKGLSASALTIEQIADELAALVLQRG
jgi:hypothetical protein